MAVGWYLRFSLSYRDVEELLAEPGLRAAHVTVWRWVQRYAPELERRLRRRLKPTNDSWRVDETYIRLKGKWLYLYRALDSTGATIDFLLSAKGDATAAERFLAKALGGEIHPAPRLTGGLYSDQQIPIAKRAMRLPMGLLTALHGELLNVAIEGGLGLNLSTAGSCRSPFHFPPSLSRLRLGWFV